jgi:serine/threonine-protein kinase RsbW
MTGRDAVRLAIDLGRLTAVRHEVAGFATAAGLAGRRLSDLVLAVNELVTNAVQHGGGTGGVRLWCTAEAVCAEITDHGPGLPPRHDAHRRPPPSASGGRGLWLVHRLCDEVAIVTGPAGTTVTVAQNLG